MIPTIAMYAAAPACTDGRQKNSRHPLAGRPVSEEKTVAVKTSATRKLVSMVKKLK